MNLPPHRHEVIHPTDPMTAAIRNWHRPQVVGANHYDGGLRRHCTECRHPWPCRTYRLVTEERG